MCDDSDWLFLVGAFIPKTKRMPLKICIFMLLMTLDIKHAAYSQTSTRHKQLEDSIK